EVIERIKDEVDGGGDADGEKADEPLADIRAGEGVYGLHHAGAREERAEDTEEESRADQDDVPDLHHALLLLHHDGVEEGGAGEPRKDGRVLDRIPAPVAAPAEDVIGPGGA